MSTTKGTKRYYEMLRGTTRDTKRTTMYYETVRVTTSGTTRYYEVLRVTMRYYKVIRVVLQINMWYNERSKVQCVLFWRDSPKDHLSKKSLRKILWNSRKNNCDRVLALMKLQPHADNFIKKDSTAGAFLWYWTTANFEALLSVIKKLDIMPLRVTNGTSLHLVVSRSTNCSTSQYPIVPRSTIHSTRSINCGSYYNWSTQTWKNTKESFSFLKSYNQKNFVVVKGAARHIYRLLKVFIWFDNTILCKIVGKRGISNSGKKSEVH